ncbi:unnamed protein product [Schistosoma mattheei]|uniref:Uncharacterized protein n=1 Tax=Schistosoma mattheei TaxID=31246 RepID=A0A3P8FXH1_9TREM|nr:unnamed protein product [Schistosoma mattheei]
MDQPLRLILEPKDVDQPYIEKTLSTNEQFIPQNFFTNNRPTPTEEDIFISYSVFQNALEKFRSCIVENYAQVDSESWLKDVHCASSSLCQSVKAVLAAVCYGMAFSDVINALGNIQTSPTLVSNLQSTIKNTSKTLVNLKRDIKPQSRKKLHNLILSLTKNLLCQLSAFFIWRQVNISVNPQLIGNSNFLSNGVSNESFSYLTNKQLYHTKNGRPKAMLITDDVDGEFFNDRQQCKLCICMCAFESIEASILLFLYNDVP